MEMSSWKKQWVCPGFAETIAITKPYDCLKHILLIGTFGTYGHHKSNLNLLNKYLNYYK